MGRTQPHHANVRARRLFEAPVRPPCPAISRHTTLPWGDIARRSRVDPPMQQLRFVVVEPCLSVTRHRRLRSQVRQSPSTHTPSFGISSRQLIPLCVPLPTRHSIHTCTRTHGLLGSRVVHRCLCTCTRCALNHQCKYCGAPTHHPPSPRGHLVPFTNEHALLMFEIRFSSHPYLV